MKMTKIRATVAVGLVPAVALVAAVASPLALAQDGGAVPRTPDGRPDLQGNWTNGTITPIERPQGFEAVLTPEQVADIEGGRQECIEAHSQASDPERDAPAEGGVSLGCDFVLDAAAGGTGGYNVFYLDRGDQVAVVNGEPRSSLLTRPEDGRIPARTAEAQERLGGLLAARGRHGEYDNPENRPLSERCIVSFGSNAGPPMLPNLFLQQQLHDRADAGSRRDHDGDGARHPHHPAQRPRADGRRRRAGAIPRGDPALVRGFPRLVGGRDSRGRNDEAQSGATLRLP